MGRITSADNRGRRAALESGAHRAAPHLYEIQISRPAGACGFREIEAIALWPPAFFCKPAHWTICMRCISLLAIAPTAKTATTIMAAEIVARCSLFFEEGAHDRFSPDIQ
jgi:hypothetical protein